MIANDNALLSRAFDAFPGCVFIASGAAPGSKILWVNRGASDSNIAAVGVGDTVPTDLFGMPAPQREQFLSTLARGEAVIDLVAVFAIPGRAARLGRITASPAGGIAGGADSGTGTETGTEAGNQTGNQTGNVLFQIADLQSQNSPAPQASTGEPSASDFEALFKEKQRALAHDLRNILTIILGNAQLIEEIESTGSVHESAEDIRIAAEQLRALIDTFAKA